MFPNIRKFATTESLVTLTSVCRNTSQTPTATMKCVANTVSKSVAGKEAKALSKALRKNSDIANDAAKNMIDLIVRMATQPA